VVSFRDVLAHSAEFAEVGLFLSLAPFVLKRFFELSLCFLRGLEIARAMFASQS
jgi:hypothetical protein